MEPTSSKDSKNGVGYIPEIDSIRAIAFFLVVIVHFSIPKFTDAVSEMGSLVASIVHLGWFGVPIFLFISGYSLGNGKFGRPVKVKNFFINRLLRIYPLYLICAIMVAFTNSLDGKQVISILLMQTQDIPKLSPFAVLWTIKLEFFCYLFFPVLIYNLKNKLYASYLFIFLFLIRVFLYFLPLNMVWELSYSTIFGGLTLFSARILGSSFPIPVNKRKSLFLFITGIFIILGLMNLFYRLGGDHGFEFSNNKFYPILLLFPEIISIAMILLIGGLRGLNLKYKCIIWKILTHIGRISYSGYIFHLFVLDFFLRLISAFSFSNSNGYISYLLQFISYIVILILFSHISYKAIELPFLSIRRQYSGNINSYRHH